MCTITFWPRKGGYALAMNRDEKLTRPPGLPPKRQFVAGRAVISPSEPGGGTWIALNDSGATLALVNWYAIPARVPGDAVTRGQVVRAARHATTAATAATALAELPLKKINPFRLVGIFPATGEAVEWRWNLQQLERVRHRWRPQQWISSGFDEPTAQRVRGEIFQRARRQSTAGRLDGLRRLHRSHQPERGPFSTCMHRADATTVSYAEIVVSPRAGVLHYQDGAPCQQRAARQSRHCLSLIRVAYAT